jgi:hypothetical protein
MLFFGTASHESRGGHLLDQHMRFDAVSKKSSFSRRLRERREDIPPLVAHFAGKHGTR